MTDTLEMRLRMAVESGYKARSRFYASIALEDEQVLGEPADLKLILSLEAFARRPLPPSYKIFLSIHDGWQMIDGVCDLLSIRDMISGKRAESIRSWQEKERKDGEMLAGTGFVIGHSEISQKRIILDYTTVSSDGECRIVQWDVDETIFYNDFATWLEETAKEFRDLADHPGPLE